MWPKALAQFLELLPHITRLIPMADMFFATKTASEKVNEARLTTLANDVRVDLTHVTAAHDGLYRQLQAHAAQLAEVAADVNYSRLAVESHSDRLTTIEQRVFSVTRWLQAAVVLLVLILILAVIILLRTL